MCRASKEGATGATQTNQAFCLCFINHLPPTLPWSRIGTDLFEFRGEHYLLSVCYRSKFPEVTKSTTSASVIQQLKRQFAMHGIPVKVLSDNDPQYSSVEFDEFATEYGFKHVTTSPHYPQANGEVERMVQTIKKLWQKNKDKAQHHCQVLRCHPLNSS